LGETNNRQPPVTIGFGTGQATIAHTEPVFRHLREMGDRNSSPFTLGGLSATE